MAASARLEVLSVKTELKIEIDTVGFATKEYQIPFGQREHFKLPGGVDVQADAGTTIIASQDLAKDRGSPTPPQFLIVHLVEDFSLR